MKKFSIIIVSIFISLMTQAQSPIGAWESITVSETGDSLRNIVIFADGYQALSVYNVSSGKFIHSNGGTWKLKGDTMIEKVEFHTDKPALIGAENRFKVAITNDSLKIIGTKNVSFNKIDDGKPGALHGAWLMYGRVNEGNEQLRDTSVPRKTMKILSGTRFQWIAFNTETKEFLGTGGGTYTSQNGEYVESIEFFSRDNTRVGLKLKFKYQILNGKWYHSGLSSKGESIHEIWAIRK